MHTEVCGDRRDVAIAEIQIEWLPVTHKAFTHTLWTRTIRINTTLTKPEVHGQKKEPNTTTINEEEHEPNYRREDEVLR